MTDFRNPVETSVMKETLRCIDFDMQGNRVGTRCLDNQNNTAPERSCSPCPGRCQAGGFLYPRSKRGDGTIHFHQGIDLTPSNAKLGPQTPADAADREAHGVRILSVCAGQVKYVKSSYTNDSPTAGSTYGNVVVIEESGGRRRHFLYAHCHRVLVEERAYVTEGQPIAIVGRTGIVDNRIKDHLHFEVAEGRLPLRAGAADETKPGIAGGVRVDPLTVLRELGPWGMSQVCLPNAKVAVKKEVVRAHADLEGSAHGRFPLGSNNLWHGGIHLRVSADADLHAPFDGEIIAFRLDPDAQNAYKAYGSTNFVLMRHEIAESVAQRFRGGTPEKAQRKASTERKPGVGKGTANEPADVLDVKRWLNERSHPGTGRRYYDPDPPSDVRTPTVSSALIAAIEAFQRDELGYSKGLDFLQKGGTAWSALKPEESAPPLDDAQASPETSEEDATKNEFDPARTVYSLFMHVEALPLDDDTVTRFPWLTEVVLEPSGESEKATEQEAVGAEGDESDVEVDTDAESDATRRLSTEKVGPEAWLGFAADPEDVKWVQRQLRRHYAELYAGGVTGLYDEATTEGIRAVQNAHHPDHRKLKDGPGYVMRGGGTERLLRKSTSSPRDAGGTSKGRASKPRLDPEFVRRASTVGGDGLAPIFVDQHIPVRAGQALWAAAKPVEQITWEPLPGQQPRLLSPTHWEIFSEQALFADWAELEDDDSDIAAPKKLIQMAEEFDDGASFRKDGIVSEDELAEFYRTRQARELRRAQVRFRTEWSWHVDEVARHLEDLGFDTDHYVDAVTPYQWYPVVFGDEEKWVVWHYHPIEFVATYQAELDEIRAEQTALVDPKNFGAVDVKVYGRDGRVLPGVDVELSGESKASSRTDGEGMARFSWVRLGTSTLVLKGGGEQEVVDVESEKTAFVTFNTSRERTKVKLRVSARTARSPQGQGLAKIPIAAKNIETGQVTTATTQAGGSVDLDLEVGEYEVSTSVSGYSTERIVLADKSRQRVELLRAVSYTVWVQYNKQPRNDIAVAVLDEGGLLVAGGVTEGEGTFVAELAPGTYHFVVGAMKSVKKTVSGGSTRLLRKLEHDAGVPPEPSAMR